MRRVKMIKPQSCGCHLIENWRFDMWMTVIARFFPTMVIPHHEDDVRLYG